LLSALTMLTNLNDRRPTRFIGPLLSLNATDDGEPEAGEPGYGPPQDMATHALNILNAKDVISLHNGSGKAFQVDEMRKWWKTHANDFGKIPDALQNLDRAVKR
jgi:hypothetical protein